MYIILEVEYEYHNNCLPDNLAVVFNTKEEAIKFFEETINTKENLNWNSLEEDGEIEDLYSTLYLEEYKVENYLSGHKKGFNDIYLLRKLKKYEYKK